MANVDMCEHEWPGSGCPDCAKAGKPSILTDGPYEISKTRLWLARQLLDSKLSDKEAFSIVAYHPSIYDMVERREKKFREALEQITHRFTDADEALSIANKALEN